MVQLVTHLFMVVAFLLFFPLSLSLSLCLCGELGERRAREEENKRSYHFCFLFEFFSLFFPPKFPFV